MRHLYRFTLTILFITMPCLTLLAEDELVQVPTNEVVEEVPAPAKKKQPISVRFDVRVDWQGVFAKEKENNNTGWGGQYINFHLDGNISDHFSYHLRYRLNKISTTASSLFEAADWAYLRYDINKNWHVQAGKIVMAIGGYEYDKAPIDVYFWSGACGDLYSGFYTLGIEGGYTTNDGKNTIIAQVTNTPVAEHSYQLNNMYAYNLAWYGNYGVWNSIWSANILAYDKDAENNCKYASFIALGNQFNAGPVKIEIDYMNRFYWNGSHSAWGFFKDFSLIGKVNYTPAPWVNLFVKGGYDYNVENSDSYIDLGRKDGYIGAGAEFFPVKNTKDVRVHLFWHSYSGNERDNLFAQHNLALGFKWMLRAFER